MITHTLPKPAKSVIGLAWDGSALWAGDWESRSLMRLGADGAIDASFPAPGRLVGLSYIQGSIYAVVSDPDTDDRSIHRFDPAHAGWELVMRCPDDTGSQLAWDGQRLWLSQRYAKRALCLAQDGSVQRTIELPAEITGIHWMGSTLWANLRVHKGTTDIGRLTDSAPTPELLEHYENGFVSLAYDGTGFWMSDLRGTTIARAVPPVL